MDAGPDGSRKVVWTSLREEPVLVGALVSVERFVILTRLQYINSRPHVLRLVDKPLTNVE